MLPCWVYSSRNYEYTDALTLKMILYFIEFFLFLLFHCTLSGVGGVDNELCVSSSNATLGSSLWALEATDTLQRINRITAPVGIRPQLWTYVTKAVHTILWKFFTSIFSVSILISRRTTHRYKLHPYKRFMIYLANTVFIFSFSFGGYFRLTKLFWIIQTIVTNEVWAWFVSAPFVLNVPFHCDVCHEHESSYIRRSHFRFFFQVLSSCETRERISSLNVSLCWFFLGIGKFDLGSIWTNAFNENESF